MENSLVVLHLYYTRILTKVIREETPKSNETNIEIDTVKTNAENEFCYEVDMK
jgi:hypothetical protein